MTPRRWWYLPLFLLVAVTTVAAQECAFGEWDPDVWQSPPIESTILAWCTWQATVAVIAAAYLLFRRDWAKTDSRHLIFGSFVASSLSFAPAASPAREVCFQPTLIPDRSRSRTLAMLGVTLLAACLWNYAFAPMLTPAGMDAPPCETVLGCESGSGE